MAYTGKRYKLKPETLEQINTVQSVIISRQGLDLTQHIQDVVASEVRSVAITLTPAQIYRKDKLFSQLKRESNLSDVGDILVPSADGGTVSLFDEFKKVFADTLDANSPKNIRALNKQYRQYATMTEAIEDTLLKGGGNLENIPLLKTNPAEFAKVNLRRIFGEAGSSPAFEAVADAMDIASRGLGYKGASPKAVAEFAQEMRKLFPEITPKTGFSGGIKASLAGVADTVLKAGAPELIDQQRALINLLSELQGAPKRLNLPK